MPARLRRPRSLPALIILGLSACTYLTALFMPALLFEDHEPVDGKALLAIGWMGVFVGQVAWYANVFYFTAGTLALLRLYRGALLCSLPAVPIGLHTLKATSYYFNESQGTAITGIGPAFGVWMAAMGLAVLGCAAGAFFRPASPSS